MSPLPQFDPSDWIALIAVLVAAGAVVYAHLSYRNAQRSTQIAERSISVAEKSLDLSRAISDRELPRLVISASLQRISRAPAQYDLVVRFVNGGGGRVRVEACGFASGEDPMAEAATFRSVGPFRSNNPWSGHLAFPLDLEGTESQTRQISVQDLVPVGTAPEGLPTLVFAEDSLRNRIWAPLPPDAVEFMARIARWARPETQDDEYGQPMPPDLDAIPPLPTDQEA